MSANGGEAAELPNGDAPAEPPAAREPEITSAAPAEDEAQAEAEIRPEVAAEEPTTPPGHGEGSKLQSGQGGQGGRTFTMRELLNDLKEGRGESSPRQSGGSGFDDRRSRNSPMSQESPHRHGHNNAAMELINSVIGVDEEGRSRQRVLVFAAKRYASAIERNPQDYDALYNWALVLQESADNVSPNSSSPSKDALLEEACRKYDEATRLCPTLHDAFYNWAIAISDRAKMRGHTKEAEELWKQPLRRRRKDMAVLHPCTARKLCENAFYVVI